MVKINYPVNTLVKVEEFTSSWKPKTPYSGIVKDIRLNVKGLGSVEYLVTPNDKESFKEKWVSERFINALKSPIND